MKKIAVIGCVPRELDAAVFDCHHDVELIKFDNLPVNPQNLFFGFDTFIFMTIDVDQLSFLYDCVRQDCNVMFNNFSGSPEMHDFVIYAKGKNERGNIIKKLKVLEKDAAYNAFASKVKKKGDEIDNIFIDALFQRGTAQGDVDFWLNELANTLTLYVGKIERKLELLPGSVNSEKKEYTVIWDGPETKIEVSFVSPSVLASKSARTDIRFSDKCELTFYSNSRPFATVTTPSIKISELDIPMKNYVGNLKDDLSDFFDKVLERDANKV